MKAFKYSKVSRLEEIFNHICKLAYPKLTINPLVASLYNFLSSLHACRIYLRRHMSKTLALQGNEHILNLAPRFSGPIITKVF